MQSFLSNMEQMYNDCWANPSTPVHQFKGTARDARKERFFLRLHKKCESTLTREHSGRLTIGYKHVKTNVIGTDYRLLGTQYACFYI